MFDLQGITIPGLNLADGTYTLPIWVAGLVLVLLLLFLILGFVRGSIVGMVVFFALIALGGGAYWAYTEHDRIDERRALENRLAELRTNALAPGSSLSCLDGGSEAIEAACEKALFAGPESVAAAMTYSAARLTLLSDGLKFAGSRDPGFESAFDNLRRALEQDRYGVVANVLMVNNGCTADRCEALALLREPARVRANLRDKKFDTLVARYAPTWQTIPTRSGAAMTSGAPSNATAAVVGGPSAEAPAPPPAPVAAEPTPPAAPPVAAAPAPPRRPAPARPGQPRTQAQRAPAQLPSPLPRVQ